MPGKTKKVLLGIAGLLALVSFGVVLDAFFLVPDFTKLNGVVEVPIKLADGSRAIRKVGPQAAGWVSLSSMSPWISKAVVASEDASFYSHKGIDVFEIQEAFKKDLKEGRFARGASTLTQQVLKNVYLSDSPKLWRKVKEILWASKLEAALTKSQILAFYLNMAEWGPGLYGVGEASSHYFSTPPSALSPRQAAFLAMLLPSPRRYHSYFRQKQLTEWAAKRVNRILHVMNKMNQLPEDAYQLALNENLWGTSVLPDQAPGAPVDPGWGVSESEDEVFEVPRSSSLSVAPKKVPPIETQSDIAPAVEPPFLGAPGETEVER